MFLFVIYNANLGMDETAEIVEERDTIFTTVFDRYDMESFQQISKDLALFGAFTDTIYQ